MLGPSMVFLGLPAAFCCSIVALSRGTDRVIAMIAMVASSLELAAFAVLFVMAFLFFAS